MTVLISKPLEIYITSYDVCVVSHDVEFIDLAFGMTGCPLDISDIINMHVLWLITVIASPKQSTAGHRNVLRCATKPKLQLCPSSRFQPPCAVLSFLQMLMAGSRPTLRLPRSPPQYPLEPTVVGSTTDVINPLLLHPVKLQNNVCTTSLYKL